MELQLTPCLALYFGKPFSKKMRSNRAVVLEVSSSKYETQAFFYLHYIPGSRYQDPETRFLGPGVFRSGQQLNEPPGWVLERQDLQGFTWIRLR